MNLTFDSAPTGATVVPGDSQEGLTRIVEQLLVAEHQRGKEQGHAEANATAALALESAGERFDQLTKDARGQVSETAVTLALEIARRLLRVEVEAGRYDLEKVVREALEESGTGRRNCTVHLNPKDAERLSEVAFRNGTELEADISVPIGNVHITTPDGLLVRDLDRAIEAIGERIFGELR